MLPSLTPLVYLELPRLFSLAWAAGTGFRMTSPPGADLLPKPTPDWWCPIGMLPLVLSNRPPPLLLPTVENVLDATADRSKVLEPCDSGSRSKGSDRNLLRLVLKLSKLAALSRMYIVDS